MSLTLIGLLQESVVKFPSLAAVKTRNPDGSHDTLTYAALYASVKELGTGLISIGLKPGTHVAVIAENGKRWLASDFAILGSGGVTVPLSTRMSDSEMEFVISHSDSEIALVENPAILQRLLAIRRRLPALRKIVIMDLPGAKPHVEADEYRVLLYTWDEVLKKGRSRIERGERQFDLRAAGVLPTATATILYTSGTTGRPKGVMLSHGNIMHNVTTVHASIGPEPGTTWLSVLPVWHSFERTVEYCSVYFGSTIAYSQPFEWKIFDDLKSLAPEYLVIVPGLLEMIQKSIEKRIGPLELALIRFEKFYLVFSGFIMGRFPRYSREERLLEVFAAILPLAILWPLKLLSRLLLRRTLKPIIGGSLRSIVCGGGPLPVHLDRYFAALGINILEGYGLTEASPIVAVRVEQAPVLGTAGRPLPDTEVRILGDNGQILGPGQKGAIMVKGPQVMQGYYKDEAATRRVLSPDGWLDTGDNGVMTIDGNLSVSGRVTHTLVLRSGERVEPEPIESAIQESPYVREAVLVGDNRESLGLLIVPDMEALRGYATGRGIAFSDDGDLTRNPSVFRFYQEEVQSRLLANAMYFPGGRAAKIALIPASFEVGRELTRTMTKKREVISAMYAPVIDRLYRS